MKRFGIFGWPVAHSLSPSIHNPAFKKANLDWTYELWPTKPEELEQAILDFRTQGFSGANVTVPHKEKVIAYLDGLTPTAQAIGAVNTLYWDGDKLFGDNTDAAGFLEDLLEKGVQLADKSVLVLGAGGSAKAIGYALQQAGVASIETWTRRAGSVPVPRDLTVNCTPGLDLEILEQVNFEPGQILYDLVYVPEETSLMHKAIQDGAIAFNGKGMLFQQARLSFEIWKRFGGS